MRLLEEVAYQLQPTRTLSKARYLELIHATALRHALPTGEGA